MAKGGSEKKKQAWDVAIVGAGPAGATAALLLATKGHQVVLIDRSPLPRKQPALGWLNARALDLLTEWGLPIKTLLHHPFSDVTFHNADFTKTAKPHFKDVVGYLVDRTVFANALVDAAKRAGAKVWGGSSVTRLKFRESEVMVDLEGGELASSRLVILASGYRGELFEQAGFARTPGIGLVWSAQVDRPMPKSAVKEKPRVVVVLGLDRRGGFVIFCLGEERVSATVHWFGDQEGILSTLTDVCRLAYEKKITPVNLSPEAANAVVFRNPVAAALDMDTHITKHCMVIGDAGGFIAAVSQEGLFPAIWSAQIAADVVDEALRSRHSQDVLKSFDTAWRMKMANYLRSPNTDPQFLVPLVFTNQPMADRMAAAFFSGENI